MNHLKYCKALIILIFSLALTFCSTEPEENSPLNFGWETATPEEVNLDPQMITDGFNAAAKESYINSLLIVRNGKLVAEKYFNGYSLTGEHNVRSVSKIVLSAAYGIAFEKSILQPDDKIMRYLPGYESELGDPRFKEVTVLNLLRMKGGLDNDLNTYFKVFESKNWLQTIFDLGLRYPPGEQYSYSTPGTHLLSAVLTKASGVSSREFIETNLIAPMNISLEDWDRDPQGFYFGGNNMYFTTRNMASFGLMYMNDGALNGKQIVPKDWVISSLKDYSTPLGDWGVLKNITYGQLWWMGEIKNQNVFAAIGHGGQFIICIPNLDMILVSTAESNIFWQQADRQETRIMEIMADYFIEAAE